MVCLHVCCLCTCLHYSVFTHGYEYKMSIYTQLGWLSTCDSAFPLGCPKAGWPLSPEAGWRTEEMFDRREKRCRIRCSILTYSVTNKMFHFHFSVIFFFFVGEHPPQKHVACISLLPLLLFLSPRPHIIVLLSPFSFCLAKYWRSQLPGTNQHVVCSVCKLSFRQALYKQLFLSSQRLF